MWSAVISQVVVLFSITGIFKAIGVDAGLVEDILVAVLQLFAIIGMVNDPTNKIGW